MIAEDLILKANSQISNQEICDRLYELAIKEHAKIAGRNGGYGIGCRCEYCSTITEYVRAKIHLNKLDKYNWENEKICFIGNPMQNALKRLAVATKHKKMMCKNIVRAA